jgi:hypothetical protein
LRATKSAGKSGKPVSLNCNHHWVILPQKEPTLMFTRYAIYFTPLPGDLARLGAAWLGWDVAAGATVQHPDIAGVDVENATKAPRKYGLHGTIKAPFILADGRTEQELANALSIFCTNQRRFTLDGLTLSQIGRFLALTDLGDSTHLNTLAADAVRSLDPFRTPMDATELNRKNRRGLSDQHRAYLHRWGYPYVMEFFQFHITLTGPLSDKDSAATHSALDAYLVPAIPSPLIVDSLTLCGEDKEGRFHQISRFALGEASNIL